jgi:hypothetical protein
MSKSKEDSLKLVALSFVILALTTIGLLIA